MKTIILNIQIYKLIYCASLCCSCVKSFFPGLLFNMFSVDELRKLLSDKDAYQSLLLSLEPVKTRARVSCDCWIFCFILLACSRPLLSTINMYTVCILY